MPTTSSSIPPEFTIRHKQGDTLVRKFIWNETGVTDVSGYTFSYQIFDKATETLEASGTFSIDPGDNLIFYLRVAHTVTATLRPCSHFHEMQAIRDNGDKITLFKGDLIIEKDRNLS